MVVLKSIIFQFEVTGYFGKVEYEKSHADCFEVKAIVNESIILRSVTSDLSQLEAEWFFRAALVEYKKRLNK